MAPDAPGVRRPRRRGLVVAALVLGIGAVVGIVSCVAVVDHALHPTIGGRVLSPIPVSGAACPYLRPVHAAAVSLNNMWTRELGESGGLPAPPWPVFRSRLTVELAVLVAAMQRARPHVPSEVAAKFDAVAHQVRIGRPALLRAQSWLDVVMPTGRSRSPVIDGADALFDASDLVGSACGYVLAPNSLLP